MEASSSIMSMAESSKRVVNTIETMKLKVSADPASEKAKGKASRGGDIDGQFGTKLVHAPLLTDFKTPNYRSTNLLPRI